MEDFQGFATILCLNMLLDNVAPDPVAREALVSQIVGAWEKQCKQQLQGEASVLHGAPPEGMDVEAAHAKYVNDIRSVGLEVRRILNGHKK